MRLVLAAALTTLTLSAGAASGLAPARQLQQDCGNDYRAQGDLMPASREEIIQAVTGAAEEWAPPRSRLQRRKSLGEVWQFEGMPIAEYRPDGGYRLCDRNACKTGRWAAAEGELRLAMDNGYRSVTLFYVDDNHVLYVSDRGATPRPYVLNQSVFC